MPRLAASQFVVDRFVLEHEYQSDHTASQSTPLVTIANRYRSTQFDSGAEHTLVFIHGTGFHKEQWETTLRYIYATGSVREAWALDWQDHGEAAGLNQATLDARGFGVSCHDVAHSITAFIKSEHIESHQDVVLIGHSRGAVATLFSVANMPLKAPSIRALILIDPAMVPKDLWDPNTDNCQAIFTFSLKAAASRRPEWPSKEDACTWMKSRRPWKGWDNRVLKAFVDHALDQRVGHVRLKCRREHESQHYRPSEVLWEAPRIMAEVSHTKPVHLIWGGTPDMIPLSVRNKISEMLTAGAGGATVSVVENAGHLVPAEQPEGLALAILKILQELQTGNPPQRTKL